MIVPNILESEVPVGKDEEDNVEKELHGKKIEKDNWFSHQDILEKINGADLKRASKISGRRFYFLTGDLARLELALINFAIETLCENGYSLTTPPFLMNREAYEGVVDLTDFEEVMYKIEDHDLYLIATSEHPITARFKNEIIELKDGPLKFAGISLFSCKSDLIKIIPEFELAGIRVTSIFSPECSPIPVKLVFLFIVY